MKLNTKKLILVTLIFIIAYSLFVINVDFSVENYSDIIVATTFFFTLYTGFFMTRQNDRYSAVSDLIATADGCFSYLYRATSVVPRIQNEVREIIRAHYTKILESGNWAYHIDNPSNTLTKMTKTLTSVTEEENKYPAAATLGFCWEVVFTLQVLRKKTVSILSEKLVALHWIIVYLLSFLLIVSFSLVPTSSLFVEILQILFGSTVFMAILLLMQLDHLTIFDDNAAASTAKDVLHIIDEKDADALDNK